MDCSSQFRSKGALFETVSIIREEQPPRQWYRQAMSRTRYRLTVPVIQYPVFMSLLKPYRPMATKR